MYGVKFGDRHSFDDFGLVLTSKVVPYPRAKRRKVDIPGCNGELDLTNVISDQIVYNNRVITLTFQILRRPFMHQAEVFADYLHGKTMKVILDEDKEWAYFGCCEINEFQSNYARGIITVEVDAQPFKEKTDLEAWLWDPFDFIGGRVSPECYTINGTQTINLLGSKMRARPRMTTDRTVTVTIDGTTRTYYAGTYDLDVYPDENGMDITVSGTNANVTFTTHRGKL